MSIVLFIKGLFRILSFVALVLAVLVGVMDSVRSVSTQALDMMSAHAIWSLLFPQTLDFTADMVEHFIHPEAWRTILHFLSETPASGVLLVISLLLWMIGYRKQKLRPAVFVPVV